MCILEMLNFHQWTHNFCTLFNIKKAQHISRIGLCLEDIISLSCALFLRKGFVSQIWKSSPWCELFPLPNSSFSYDLLDPKKPVFYETTKQHCFIHQMAHISGLLDFTSFHFLFKHVHPENLGEMLTHVDYKNWSENIGSKATKSTKKSEHTRFLAWGNPVNYIVCCLAKIKFDIYIFKFWFK